MVKKLRPINSNVGRYFDAMRDINAYGSTLNPNAFATDMALARQKKQEYEDFLGKTDYSGKLKDSEDLAKLQLGLALAQRGFAAMGAQPRRGESAIGVLGRTLVAPLAGDLSTVAGRLMQQRQAVKLAEQQEERQLALSALTAATSEGKERRDLALRLLKDGTKKTAKGPFEGLKWVLEKDTEGNWQHVGENNEPVQVRQRRGKPGELFDPINVRTKLARPLEEGEVLFATLPDNLKGTDKTGASSDKVLDAGFAREIKRDPNDPAKIVFGPIVETKIVYTKDGFKQYRADNNEVITIGDNFGDYRMYEKTTSTAATKPKGVKDPEFLSKFKGMLSKIPRIQEQLEIGRAGLKFDPQKYNNNPELASGVDFPFTRQDGGKFSKKQQETYLNNLKNAYFSDLKNIRAGQDLVNLDTAFIKSYLESSPGNLGLPKAPTRAVIPPEQITNPAAIQTRYGELAPEFQTQDANTVLDKAPLPVGRSNLNSGFGKLVLMKKGVGVKFDESTKAPAPLANNADPTDIENRRKLIKNLDKRNVQARLLAENIGAGTSLAGKLRPGSSLNDKIVVTANALEAKRKKLNDALNDPEGKEIGQTVGKSLETLALLDRVDVNMKKSGLPGFIIGPLKEFFVRKFDADIDWFQTAAGKDATKELVATLPILNQLVARDLAKGVGEQRISDRDLKGIQKTLISIGEGENINARQLQALRRYLKNSVKHSLEYVGSYGLPERVLEQAATLGVDVKSIQGRNEFYSPYLKDRKYAVTKQDVPSYSRAYQKQLRDNRIFGYSAIRPESGGTKQYELLKIDRNGQPIWDARNGKYKTVLVPAGKGWQTSVPGGAPVLDFNRNWLLKTYSLGN